MSKHSSSESSHRLDQAINRVVTEIYAGVHHGYFEYTLTCEIVSQGKRKLVLRAGEHYQFLIGADECETRREAGDPQHEGADQSHV
jgi:hypothetical protein